MHRLETGSMRCPIETVPKDGKAVILEDDTAGTYELAHWSAEEGVWVGENGRPCTITPTYWLAMHRAEHLENECKSSGPLQTGTTLPASEDVFAPPPLVTSSELASVAGFDKQIPRGKAHAAPAKRRFATYCGAAMVAVSLTGMYFRGDFAAYVTRHADRIDELVIGSERPDLATEQPRKVSLAPDPTLQQAEIDKVSVPAPASQVTVGAALPRSPENYSRADAPEKELFKEGQALAEALEREIRLKQAAETASTELRQSLDKITILENELALARRHIEQASPSPRRARRIPQRRLGSPHQQDFFGLFNSAPGRARFQRSARIR